MVEAARHNGSIEAFVEAAAQSVVPQYFRLRRLEFELLKMLSPEIFHSRFERALELGCGIGFFPDSDSKNSRIVEPKDILIRDVVPNVNGPLPAGVLQKVKQGGALVRAPFRNQVQYFLARDDLRRGA